MGCASSVNVKIEEDTDNRKVLANGKEVGNLKKNNIEKIDEKSEENKEEEYLELPSKTENTLSKSNTKTKSKIKIKENSKIKINNIKINDKYYNNQSTNFKYLKDDKALNLVKSNQINENKNEDDNQNKYISLRHPIDSSLDNNEPKNKNLGNIYISTEKENNKYNNYGDNDDGVNMGNFDEDNNDDMCNLGQSVNLDKVKNNKKQNENKEISITFEMQTTGVKYIININNDITLLELIETFKKKVKLSPFEKPEFVFNDVFLVDFDKTISYYKINDSSKINVYL